MITVVTGLNASLEAAWAFKSIFAATSGVDYIVLTSRDFGWERRVTTACTTAMTLIGDSMLVSITSRAIYWPDRVLTAVGLSLLHHM